MIIHPARKTDLKKGFRILNSLTGEGGYSAVAYGNRRE